MDNLLCDELLQEIFARIPKFAAAAVSPLYPSVSLVSKRWLHLYRISKTSLSLRLNPDDSDSTVESLNSFLPNYPFLSSLNLEPSMTAKSIPAVEFADHLLFTVAAVCSKLKHLRFLVGPLSPSSLPSLSNKCAHLTSLDVLLSRPVNFIWVSCFSCLKELSIRLSDDCPNWVNGFSSDEEIEGELGLKGLALSGIRRDDSGFGWLWRSCKNLKRLQLESCESIGDDWSFLSFTNCLKGLEELELRTCRSIVGLILLRLAENCDSLNSLLVYDGGNQEALLHFITNCRSNLQKIDFRLPLDLTNVHLSAIAVNFRGISSITLQSCCLDNGEGLKAIGFGINSGIRELSLIKCDIVARESGLLATLGQNLRQLRKLDLSHNEFLLDKELISMLVSCSNLAELNVRNCKAITGMALLSMLKNCRELESVDIMNCCGIDFKAIELFLLNSPRLRVLLVEQSKLSDVARTWAAKKAIQV